ncbi:uncharacterized protein LOC124916678 [Impatiens glandulifera]|uniref:uncharacterized protein LOC124916678 n=1 Tax=Impatiens glandulifera TaxID=253017 RepID=UPI001FB079CD|nr:uncharacterized protein LOC124916678 [Impatiens glandulifera]
MMMGKEILRRPQDCRLIKRTVFSPAVIHHRKRGCYRNPRFIGNKKSPANERRFENGVKNSNDLVIGRVRILKRGESPQTKAAVEIERKARRISADDVITSRINRVGSDTLMMEDDDDGGVGGGVEMNMYAGSAFSMSPSPKSLPLPSFFNKTVDDSATRGLRRLLRLD